MHHERRAIAVTAEAKTLDAALAKLKKQVGKRRRNGAKLGSMELAGMFEGDPLIEDWKRSMADYRRQYDAEHDGQ